MIDATSVFNVVELSCDCVNGFISDGYAKQQTGTPSSDPPEYSGSIFSIFAIPSSLPNRGVFDPDDAQVAEVITRMRAGTARVRYIDVSGTSFWDENIPGGLEWLRGLHPFHETDSWRIRGALFDHGDYEEDSDTQQPSIEFGGGIKTDDHNLPGTDITHSTADWFVSPISATRFQVDLTVSGSDGYTVATIGNHPAIAAMIATLRAIRTSGDAIPTPFVLGMTSNLRNRDYTIPLTGGNLVVRITVGGYSLDDDNHVTEWGYTFDVQAPATSYDADAIDAWLNSNVQTIGTTTDMVVKSAIGSFTQPLRGSEVDFGDDNKISFVNGSRVSHVKKGALVRRVAEGNNLVLSYADLATEGGFKMLPTPQEFRCTTPYTSRA